MKVFLHGFDGGSVEEEGEKDDDDDDDDEKEEEEEERVLTKEEQSYIPPCRRCGKSASSAPILTRTTCRVDERGL